MFSHAPSSPPPTPDDASGAGRHGPGDAALSGRSASDPGRSSDPSRAGSDPGRSGDPGGAPPEGIARGVLAIARVTSRFRKTTLALWIVFVIGCLVAGGVTGMKTLSEDGGVGESGAAEAIVASSDLADRPTEVVLVQSPSKAATDRVATALQADLARLKQVDEIRSPLQAGGSVGELRNDDGTAVLLQVTLRGSPDDAAETALPVEQAVHAAQRDAGAGVTIAQTGGGSVGNAIDEIVESDLQKAELISVPITLIILVLVFGAFVAATVPLILGITAVAAAMGAMGVVSQVAPMADATGSLVVLIGLAVGVDYSLFYIRREREERRAGRSEHAALLAASASVGRAILISGLTVMVALAGLLMTGVEEFTSMAAGTILVVAIAVLGSLTVLPAILAILGDNVDRGRVGLPGAKRRRARRAATARDAAAARVAAGLPAEPVRGRTRRSAWSVIADRVTGAPRAWTAAACIALLALAAPVLSMKLADSGAGSLPKGVPAIEAANAIERAFPGAPDSTDLVVTGTQLDATQNTAGLARLGRAAAKVTGGASVAQVDVSGDGTVAVVSVPMPDRGANAAQDTVRDLRAQLRALTADLVPGADRTRVAGDAADSLDFADAVKDAMPLVGGFVMGLALLLLLAAFRSLRLAVTVIGLNLLSVGAAFGVMTVVFQNTFAEDLLSFTSSGAIITWMPLIAFVILFGLSMDYSILVLERIREARRRGLAAREAAAEGVAATASTVTGAALVMVAVFSIFAMLRLLEMKQLGVGMAAAILIDATIVRAIALPAAVTLLGENAFGKRTAEQARLAQSTTQRGGAETAWDDAPVYAGSSTPLAEAGARG